MVFRQLLDPLIDQVQAAVAHIGKIHHLVHDRRRNDRSPHPFEMGVAGCLPDDLPVGCFDRTDQTFLYIFTCAVCQFSLKNLNRILGSVIPRLMAAHSVRHHKKITQNTKRLICRVDIILIHLPYHSYICNRKCPHIRLLIFLPKNSLLPHSGV